VRGTKKTLCVVAAFYVVVGFFLAISAAVQGDRLGTFLGFVIISGALVTAALFRAVLRIGLRISSVGESLDDVGGRLARIERGDTKTRSKHETPSQPAPARVIDLGTSALVDASLVAAATLDHTSFPRLADTILEHPPGTAPQSKPIGETGSVAPENTEATTTEATNATSTLVSHRNLLRSWKVALRDGDFATCRDMYAAMVDTVEPQLVVRLSEQYESLARVCEQALREKFASCVREQDFDGALSVGREIVRLMPDRLVAEEYAKLEAHLLRRRAQAQHESSPPLRLAH
jgi:hypothetical protein